ncbi:MAG: outer membrane beta-barrel protein [Balneolaceae bacterium]|nr:outer membrane beta-barrel protein [Balneolaceae bacterium]
MKYLSTLPLVSLLLLLTVSVGYAQNGDITLGGGLIFGSGVSGIDQVDNDLGIKVDGVYTINDDFRGVADFGFYFPHEQNGFKQTVWELNFNGNYLFYSEDALTLYGLGGINITNISFEQSTQGITGSGDSSEFGLNVGGGLEYGLDFGNLFAELKYVLSDADQLALGAGVRFGI